MLDGKSFEVDEHALADSDAAKSLLDEEAVQDATYLAVRRGDLDDTKTGRIAVVMSENRQALRLADEGEQAVERESACNELMSAAE